MPIELPDFGDLTYAELKNGLTVAIPKYSSEWTNYNPSDPGTTLLELLAWVSEVLVYRCNQVPDRFYLTLLRLMAGRTADAANDPARQKILDYLEKLENQNVTAALREMKAAAREFLNSSFRAVTAVDFQNLAREAAVNQNSANSIGRVEVLNTACQVEVILIEPMFASGADPVLIVADYLKARRLLGTIITVKLPSFTAVTLKICLVCKSAAAMQPVMVTEAIEANVRRHLDSLTGGPDGNGWPYNHSLTVYELFYVCEQTEGVERVIGITRQVEQQWVTFDTITVDGLIDSGVSSAMNPILGCVSGSDLY